MDSRLLRTFVAVAESASFAGAAAGLGYTQSAVSQQIAALESDLGAVLLSRRPVAVTEAGARLLEHARPLLLRMEAARAEVTRAAGPPPAALAVGSVPLAGPLAATGLAALQRSWPRLRITLHAAARDTVSAQVAAGILEAGLVDGAVAPGDPLRQPGTVPVSALTVAEAELAVVLPASHPLAGRRALRLADLADARWIDAPDTGMPLADLRAATGSGGFLPALRYFGADLATLLALAAAGQGLTVLPRAVLPPSAGVVAVQLRAPELVHHVEFVHGRLAGPAADLYAAIAAAAAGASQGP